MSASNKTLAIVVIVVIAIAGIGGIVILGGGNPFLPPENPYDVAIVFATGGLGDKSFNDGAYAGAEQAKEDYGITFTYVEPTATTEYEGFHRAYAAHAEYRDPYKMIIGIGFDQAEAIQTVAAEYPEQPFAIVDMYIDPTDYPNVTSILFDEQEGSAIVGAIAGLMTKTGKVGFVGGMDIDLINKFAAGYVWGANYSYYDANEANIAFDVQYVGSWVDTAAGQSLADAMYTAGTDIIFAAAGRSGLGVFDSAKNKNGTEGFDNPLWVIGVDSPQMYLGTDDPNNPAPPTVCLTSMLKKVDVAVYRTIVDAWSGTHVPGIKTFNLANGGLGYEINEDLLVLPQDVVNFANQLRLDIVAGNVIVPSQKYWT